MSVIDAVYQGGVFRPTTPPDLPDGTSVQVVLPDPPAVSPGRAAYEMIRAIAEMPAEGGDGPDDTSNRVDEILYGGPGGAR